MRKGGVYQACILSVFFTLASASRSYAWGPDSVQTIAQMALQVLRDNKILQEIEDTFPRIILPGGIVGTTFRGHVIEGAKAGYSGLRDDFTSKSREYIINEVSGQIMLLREIKDTVYRGKNYTFSAYFPYRMGVLASLVATLVMPYGFPQDEEGKKIRDYVVDNLEANLKGFILPPQLNKRVFFLNAKEYFDKKCYYLSQEERTIRSDFLLGRDFNRGFLKEGGRVYFIRAIEAVADAWYSIMQKEIPPVGHFAEQPSQEKVVWFLVDEMRFLLERNTKFDDVYRVYQHFKSIEPGILRAYWEVGDLFHDYAGDQNRQMKELAVAEWEYVYKNSESVQRRQMGQKLASYFLAEGNVYLKKAQSQQAEDTDLNNALQAFMNALSYDHSDDEIANQIQATNNAIRERNERLEVTLSIIATGERVHEEANRYREAKDYANAIITYRQAVGFFEAVDDEFKVHFNTAQEKIRRLRREVQDVINEVLEAASQAIDDGDRAREKNQFDEAVQHYQRVPGIVAVIPSDESPTVANEIKDLLAQAERKIEDTRVAKLRYEEALKQQAQQQPQGQPPR